MIRPELQPLARSRRFVLLPREPIADGVEFTATGLIVLTDRAGGGLHIYTGGWQQVEEVIRPDIVWLDPE